MILKLFSLIHVTDWASVKIDSEVWYIQKNKSRRQNLILKKDEEFELWKIMTYYTAWKDFSCTFVEMVNFA